MEPINSEVLNATINYTPLKMSRISPDDQKDMMAQYELYVDPIPLPEDIDIIELAHTPPIAEGEVFDPQVAFQEILTADKSERKARIADFKKKLIYQTEGYGYTHANIIKRIQRTGDIDTELIMDEYLLAEQIFGFPPAARQVLQDSLQKASETIAKVQKFKDNTPENDICRILCNFVPSHEYEVVPSKLDVTVIFENALDFARAYHKNRAEESVLEETAKSTGGFYTKRGGLPFIAINGNQGQKVIQEHEQSHMLQALIEYPADTLKNAYSSIGVSSDLEEDRKVELFDSFFLAHRHNSLIRAKDEIFAYMTDKTMTDNSILTTLTKTKERGGLYDYTADLKYEMWRSYREHSDETTATLMYESMDKVLVLEYSQILEQAIHAFSSFKKEGYGVQEVVGMLGNVPIEHWPKLYNRYKSEKEKRLTLWSKAKKTEMALQMGGIDPSNASFTPVPNFTPRVWSFEDTPEYQEETFSIQNLVEKYKKH